MSIESVNPATGETLQHYAEHDAEAIEQRLQQANTAFASWRSTSMSDRSVLMRELAQGLQHREHDLARLMTQEMGKPIKAARGEIEKCAWVCEYYADNAADFLNDEVIQTEAANSFVSYQPLGPVLAVMPWNFPFWQVFRFTAPALMAGNVALLKHASNVPGCALAIEELFAQAGFPQGCFSTLMIGSDAVDALIEDKRVKAVTLTGSEPAGRAVAAKAGAQIKKTVLELGGSDPYIVLADADVRAAAETCVASRLINSGQSCIAAKRFIVVNELHDDFVQHCVALMQDKKCGDPLDEKTDIGPMAREDLRDALHQQVQDSIAAGAECLLGGQVPDKAGAWYPATVLSNVKPGMPAYDEELFGPVAAIIKAQDTDDAIRIANDSDFGLGAAIFTADTETGERIAAEHIEAGAVAINDFVKSDPRMPFGGIKNSGYGRELSAFGIREFVNIKSVVR
ncbi:MAG: NAD-dependent succinate-semialdehyde dehydrogenase [Salinisphaeraceae bacterium]|nr:NAD-dependent succinate-semialdehyde dehydrogenase [Salinisphaeraceae bacterium]